MKLIRFLCIAILSVGFLASCAPASSSNIVGPDEVAYEINPNYVKGSTDPEKSTEFINIAHPGQSYDPVKQRKDKYLVVNTGQVAVKSDKSVVGPGVYMSEPNNPAFVTVYTAASVTKDRFMVYVGDKVQKVVVEVGVYNLPEDAVLYFPSGSQRYRTLDPSLLSDPKACSSFVCETSLTSVVMSGTVATAVIDLDVLFHFSSDQSQAQALINLGSAERSVQNYIGSKIRGLRVVSETPDEVTTQQGRDRVAMFYLAALQQTTKGTPIQIDAVIIRSVTIGDDAYRQQKMSIQAEIDRLVAEQQQLAELQRLQASKNEFAREEAKKNAVAKADEIHVLAEAVKDVDPQVAVVLLRATPDIGMGATVTPTPKP